MDWKTKSTRAKSIGTLVSIVGALIITLYKGQAVIKNHPSNKLFPKKHVSSEQFDWVLGAMLLAGHSFVLSLLFIVQVTNANLKHHFGLFANKTIKMLEISILLLLSLMFVDMDNQKLPNRACDSAHSRYISCYAIYPTFTDFGNGSKRFEIRI